MIADLQRDRSPKAAIGVRSGFPRLTDTQLVILSTASQRGDGVVLPLAKSLLLNRGAVEVVLQSLLRRGLIAERPAGSGDEVWRSEIGERWTLAITDAGLAAIGVTDKAEDPDVAAPRVSVLDHVGGAIFGTTAPRGDVASAGPAVWTPQNVAMSEASPRTDDTPPAPADGGASNEEPSAILLERPGTKTALMIALLRRPEGSTVADLSAATGWQPHSVRGAIAGQLKRRLGLVVIAFNEPDRGRVYRLARPERQSERP